jgi:hypothetical protein
MVFMDSNSLPQPAELEAALTNFHSRFHEVREFRRMLDYESHRGCALAAAAFLDERLKQLLRVDESFGPGNYKVYLDEFAPASLAEITT